MKSFASNESTITVEKTARAAATTAERGPVPLTETELDRVAAAGRKPGVSPNSGPWFET